MIKTVALSLLLLFSMGSYAQNGNYTDFQESADPKASEARGWTDVKAGAHSAFVSEDFSFGKSNAPLPSQTFNTWKGTGWKGERIHTQALIWSTDNLNNIKLTLSDLSNANQPQISKEHIQANFVRYAIADHLGTLTSGCGTPEGLDTTLQADMIDSQIAMLSIEGQTSRPIWLSINIPSDAQAGTYTGTLTVTADDYTQTLPYAIKVVNHSLAAPKDWTFHLDLWQNPYSVARYYQVTPWSDEHFAAMKPYMQMLADAGQKSITTTLINDPWNAQTYDIYGSMVQWKKKKDGTWEYDFSIFDKWVTFMMDLGVDKYINAYSMIPWNLKFYYFDEVSNSEKILMADPESPEYKAHWQPMLAKFAAHLKDKGWFDKTMIAMDERPEKHMLAVIDIIKAADPGFRISMAGNYHADLQADLLDYSIATYQDMPDETIQERKNKGMTTTFYTCCAEPFPNTFTSSPYAESTWLSWHALYKDYGGYLRWAYNCWNADPLRDTRFRSWASGDTYLVYPGARTSIRFERLREGIQDFEKVTTLRALYQGNKEKLAQLEAAIKDFDLEQVKNAEERLKTAKQVLNSL